MESGYIIMIKWMMLRGAWDCRTEKSIVDDDDMWLHLFCELIDKEYGVIWFESDVKRKIQYKDNASIYSGRISQIKDLKSVKYIFSRGGFEWQSDFIQKHQDLYTIRYGAGRRFMPESGIKYNIVLVDSLDQKNKVLEKYPKSNVNFLIKPAAKHFLPETSEKKYDLCYISKDEQAKIKSVDWVYKTIPDDLSMLHIGSDGRFNPPGNIKCIKCGRLDIPTHINRCKIGVIPYWDGVDSCPRVLPEMLACRLPVVVADKLVYNRSLYPVAQADKNTFWGRVRMEIEDYNVIMSIHNKFDILPEYSIYDKKLSLKQSAKHLRRLIYA